MIIESKAGINRTIFSIFNEDRGILISKSKRYEKVNGVNVKVFDGDWYIKNGVLLRNPFLIIKGSGYESTNISIIQQDGRIRFMWNDAPQSFGMSFDGSSMYYSGLNFYTKKIYKYCYIKAIDYRVSSRTNSSKVSVWYYPVISWEGSPLNYNLNATRTNSNLISTGCYEYGHSSYRSYSCNAVISTQYIDIIDLQIQY